MHQSIPQTPSHVKTFIACLLSFMLFVTPIAAVAAGSSSTFRGFPSDARNAKATEAELFVNGPTAPRADFAPQPAPAPEPFAPVPLPPASAVTATLAAAIANDDGDNKIDPTNGNPATTEKINYTVQLSNTSGAGATGLAL